MQKQFGNYILYGHARCNWVIGLGFRIGFYPASVNLVEIGTHFSANFDIGPFHLGVELQEIRNNAVDKFMAIA